MTLVSIFFLVDSRSYAFESSGQPGPGFFPTLAGCLMLFSSLGTGYYALSTQFGDAVVKWPSGAGLWRVIAVVGAALVFIVLLPYLGDLVTGFLAILLVVRGMGARSWLRALVAAALMVAVVHYVFSVLLGVSLPAGSVFEMF